MDDRTAPPGYLTTRQAAHALGITPGALRNLVYRGQLARAGGTERHPHYAARDVAAIAAKRRERQVA
ncbi:type IV toxin-antitoxin system AbiEi family antitoxin domain-containing protein [Streptomyces sp. NPDC006997]|uniref:type IV toxin-antitoxin system AbiEi family antitoxin domain-containing protein n=1 Tax=Streptomyces sp. NPDC006997 TaxID=3155356 RepID=UPI0033E71793